MSIITKIVDELSSISMATGIIKNIVKDAGNVSEGLSDTLNRLSTSVADKAGRIKNMTQNKTEKLMELRLEEALENSKLAEILEKLVKDFEDSIKQLADYGLDEAAKIAIKFIQDKLGNEV